jgi:hypothetical protein
MMRVIGAVLVVVLAVVIVPFVWNGVHNNDNNSDGSSNSLGVEHDDEAIVVDGRVVVLTPNTFEQVVANNHTFVLLYVQREASCWLDTMRYERLMPFLMRH